MTRHALTAVLLAIDPTGQHLSDIVKTGAGNLFIAILAVLGVVTLLRRRLLALVVLAAMAALAGVFVYAPNFLHDLTNALVQVLEGG
jgi:hypothetical protein